MHNTQSTQLLFELSKPGCRAVRLPKCDVPERPLADLLPAGAISDMPLPLPELSEPDVVRPEKGPSLVFAPKSVTPFPALPKLATYGNLILKV